MYFRWKDRRIVVKFAFWGAVQGIAESMVAGLAQHVRKLVDQGEASPPHDEQTVGLARNADPVDIDEPDRDFSLYFCHPPGEIGTFDGLPVDYKCFAPRAPVEGNRAFREALEDASGVLLLADGNPETQSHNRTALQGFRRYASELASEDSHRASLGEEGDRVVSVALRQRHEGIEPETCREHLALPDSIPVTPYAPDEPASIYEAFRTLARQIRPRLREARQQGRIPELD